MGEKFTAASYLYPWSAIYHRLRGVRHRKIFNEKVILVVVEITARRVLVRIIMNNSLFCTCEPGIYCGKKELSTPKMGLQIRL